MKTLSKIYGCLSFILLCSVIACHSGPSDDMNQKGPGDQGAFRIPELLVRQAGLKHTPEWEQHVHDVSGFQSRLIADPQDADALIRLAQVYCVEARVTGEHGYYYPAILRMLDHVLMFPELTDAELFEATVLKSNVLLSQHRWTEGLRWAEQAYALNPYSPRVYAALIDAHVELGRYPRAVELTDALMNIRPGLMAYARASYLRELHGDVNGAIEAMQMAVEAGYPGYEDTEWCRVHLGELFEIQGKHEVALAAYEQSLFYRPGNPFALAAQARVLILQKEYTEAESMLLNALEEVPEIAFQEALYELYHAWGKDLKAREAYLGILEMIEDDAAHGHQVDLDYASILLKYGADPEAALVHALREYSIRPDNILLNGLLAKIYYRLGRTTEAGMYLARAESTGYQDDELNTLLRQAG